MSPIEGTQTSPYVARNRGPILKVLRRVLPERGIVLEVASGTGEHAAYFAAGLPQLTWQPTERDTLALRSIKAYRTAGNLANLLPPLELDVMAKSWPVPRADAVVAINMIHIAPWTAAEALMAGAERLLQPGGVLYLYGPFKENGLHTAPSNKTFDENLRARNKDWGVRDVGDVAKLAARHRLDLVERVAMPANNLSVIFKRSVS
jgi:SAM-dependent methyltransferase